MYMNNQCLSSGAYTYVLFFLIFKIFKKHYVLIYTQNMFVNKRGEGSSNQRSGDESPGYPAERDSAAPPPHLRRKSTCDYREHILTTY